MFGICLHLHFFPICQVRVVRFYHSCSSSPPHPPSPPSSPPHPPPSPSPPPPLHPLPCPLPPCQLVTNFCAPISLPTSARSGHCWTSTAGCRSEWAPLDLNLGPTELSGQHWTSTLGPSELSGHRWTSTAR